MTTPDLSRDQLLEAILRAERAGDALQAADLAEQALESFPDETEFRYHHLLSLARAGALTRAEALWPRYALPETDTRYAALGARLLRERALAAGGAPALERAAAAYEAIFARDHDPFPGVNAAVLRALAGQSEAAEALARQVLAAVERATPANREASFHLAADRLQAALILDLPAEAAAALAVLRDQPANRAALTSTRRQLLRLTAALGRGRELAETLRPGPALHFTGHMLAAPGRPGRFPAAAEAAVANGIAAELDRLAPSAGFGSLASGGDILVAEALLARGADVTVVLPFDRAAFLETSVAPAGPGWVARFEAVLARAADVVQATEGPYLGDAEVFAYCSRLAMGLARLRAALEEAGCHQLAVWDGQPGNGVAGTAADRDLWAALGLPGSVVHSRPTGGGHAGSSASQPLERPLRAFLFGDFRGFSRLDETQLLTFNRALLAAVAGVLDRYGGHVELRHTWGDGLYLVFDEVAVAAACALDLQRSVAAVDRAALGLPADLGLRAALHAGPVFAVEDPVLRQRVYTGRHISRAARMEPVTPEGEVYVSEAFAALLALEAEVPVAYEYVGRVPLAKGAGHLRMYLLRGR